MKPLILLLSGAALISAQAATSSNGYTGYTLNVTGNGEDAEYETDNISTGPGDDISPPDVFLNASVTVDEIDILVQNLSAKINLDAQVLSLLTFNAGVDVSVDRVNLLIQNVTAKILLEARLENLVTMVSDVLDSIDLNPVIATLGSSVSEIGSEVGSALNGSLGSAVNGAVGSTLGAASNLTTRSIELNDNILYSVNDYSGNTHTNRVLNQNGQIVDQKLDNDGRVYAQSAVGSYSTEFSPVGEAYSTTSSGEELTEQEYMYSPYYGLNVMSVLSFNAEKQVVSARVVSELSAGGSSTIHN